MRIRVCVFGPEIQTKRLVFLFYFFYYRDPVRAYRVRFRKCVKITTERPEIDLSAALPVVTPSHHSVGRSEISGNIKQRSYKHALFRGHSFTGHHNGHRGHGSAGHILLHRQLGILRRQKESDPSE